MGVGIWAMHYVGMDAYKLPVRVTYDWPTVLISLIAAMIASWIALFLASRRSFSVLRITLGSVAMGCGISEMHYIGMEALRLPASISYAPTIVGLSVVLAIVISFLAMWLAFRMRNEANLWGWAKVGSAVLMGLAIVSTHYVGMYSATFLPAPLLPSQLKHSISVSELGLSTIVVVTLVSLVLAMVASDVNRQAAAQTLALLRSRRKLDSVFNAMTDGIVIRDHTGHYVQMNRTAESLLGSSEVAVPHSVTETTFELYRLDGVLIPVEEWPSTRAERGDYCQNLELVVKNKITNRTFFAEVSTAPVPQVGFDAPEVMVTFRDITERKQMDEAIGHIAAIVNSSEDAIIGKDLDGVVTSWNTGAEKIFGYSAAEMIGESILRVVPEELEPEEAEFLQHIAKGELVEHVETVRRRKDGGVVQVAVNISPIRNQWGKTIGASTIARDITKTKQMERQLLQSQKMDAIGQLTGGVAHDFNNLLGVVIGNLDLAERMVPEGEPVMQRIKTARKAAMRGTDLTRRLLAISSADDLKPEPMHLHHAIMNALELAARAIGPEIKVSTQFDPMITSIFADAASFESALLNLAVNARDAMHMRGSLMITTQRVDLDASFPSVLSGQIHVGSYACISVTDTGEGMTREVQERAFEPFFSTKPRGRGTGLGLAMVYGFAKQSGGTARIYSEPGLGTTVSLYLPLSASEAAPVPVSVSGIRQAYARPGGTVLVVDDEVELLNIALAYLKDLGYDALSAHDPDLAVEVLRARHDIVLMVTDIIMPHMSGVELSRKAHELNPAIKIVYSSGFPAGALEERNMGLADAPLLRKPYRASEFSATISAVMARSG